MVATSPGEVQVRVAGLSFHYPDGSPGLRDVSLEVRAGEIVLLLGANGSGKSTLLQCLIGLLPGAGSIEVCGIPLSPKTLRAVRLVAGLVFQSPDDQLFCPSVLEDVAYGPLHRGLEPAEARAIALESLHQVGLDGFEDRAPHHLSHGEKKRVAMAAVLALEPTVLLLDEPTAGLDPRSSMGLMDILEEYRREGKAILATTHDLHLVGELADRVVILGEDRTIAAQGNPEAILSDVALLTKHNLVHAHRHRHGDVVHAHPHPPLHGHEHGHVAPAAPDETRDARLHRLDHLCGRDSAHAVLGLCLAEAAAAALGRAPERMRLHCPVAPPRGAVIDGVQALRGFSAGAGRLRLEPGDEVRLEAEANGRRVVLVPRGEILARLAQGGLGAADLLALDADRVVERRIES